MLVDNYLFPTGYVEALVVEPSDVLDDGELELRSRSPDAVADQLGLEAVEEALRGGAIEGVAMPGVYDEGASRRPRLRQ